MPIHPTRASMVGHNKYKQQPTARCTRKTSNNYVYLHLMLCASIKLSNVKTMTGETNDEQDVAQKSITVINLEQTQNQLNSLSLHLLECELRRGETSFEPEPETEHRSKRWKENAILIFGCSYLCKCNQNFYSILFILVGKFILPIFRSTFSPIIHLCILRGSWQWVYVKLAKWIIKSLFYSLWASRKNLFRQVEWIFSRKGSKWIGSRQGFVG